MFLRTAGAFPRTGSRGACEILSSSLEELGIFSRFLGSVHSTSGWAENLPEGEGTAGTVQFHSRVMLETALFLQFTEAK